MPTINISEFKRNGIFIREIDNSVRQIPAQTELITLVPGFSRKGVVNKPILISTPQELLETFGDIDRLMEKKGCFFHRTILNILRNSPVWALNLLQTDDELDQIEWKSLSLSANNENAIIKTSPYSDFFDKSDFWERDTEAFITVADDNRENNNHILHITNMSNKKTSVFIYKSSASGYDNTLDVYYGTINDVPVYLNPKDQAKDYLVSMLIVAGDWSDYQTLAVDTRWGKYFSTKGLRKEQVNNFRNDSTVSILSFYNDLSVIPYFKNLNGNDIFIETVVNSETDKHGIFVAFDIDKVEESDFRNGMLDLIGSNLVDDPKETINYISYNETISETLTFETVVLNRAGNSFGANMEYETYLSGTPVYTQITGAGYSDVEITGITYYNLNGVKVYPLTDNIVQVPNVNIGKIRKDTIYLDINGATGIELGTEVSNQTQWANIPLKSLASGLLPLSIIYVGQQAQSTSGVGLGIEIINTIPNLTWGLDSTSANINVTYPGGNEVNFEFKGTKNSDPDTNYIKTKLNILFNSLQSKFGSGVSIIKDSLSNKVTIPNGTFTTDSTLNKAFTVEVSPSFNINVGVNSNIFYIDDEQSFVPTTGSISYGTKTNPSFSTSGYGIASIESDIYQSFLNGNINSGDYFYPDLFDIEFGKVDFYSSVGNSFIRLWYNSGDIDPTKLSVARKIRIFGSSGNDKVFTILSNGGEITGQPGDYNTKLELVVSESILTETVIEGVSVSGASDTDIRYLKMYLESGNLSVEFTQDETLIGINGINFATGYNLDTIKVFSNASNYKQSIEIETVVQQNEILVSADRYGEIKIGDYLQAYVDNTLLEAGEVPKRLTRIIAKQLYSADTSLVSLKTDAAIDIVTFGTDKQTFRYTTIENYVTTYSAIVLTGFKMREDSLPNGTETRQSSILDLIAVGTPIFKGLINRNKISWRYLVDPWGLGLTSNSKQQLVDLCGERLTVLGLLNMPSAKMFKKSQSPSFTDPDDKTLRLDFVKEGANPDSNPAFRYTFADGKGVSNVAYFFPYVTITDNNRPTSVPPGMFVANTFLAKHTSRLASVKPWTIAAGLPDGLVNVIGNVEMDFTDTDLENLNQMGANPIVYKMNRGFVIENDNTAQALVRSSLSYTHAREVLIELENEMYEMLLTYQWKSNTKEVRDEIKGKADKICDRFVREKGLYAYQNIMDETNNTGEIIDAQIGLIDTFVEIIKGMGIIVNNVTILKTGSIEAGGFTNI